MSQSRSQADLPRDGFVLRTQLSCQGIELLEDCQPSSIFILSFSKHVMEFDALCLAKKRSVNDFEHLTLRSVETNMAFHDAYENHFETEGTYQGRPIRV